MKTFVAVLGLLSFFGMCVSATGVLLGIIWASKISMQISATAGVVSTAIFLMMIVFKSYLDETS